MSVTGIRLQDVSAPVKASFASLWVNFVFNLMLISDVFAGVLRYSFDKIHAPQLLYVPKLLILLSPIVISIWDDRLNRRLGILLGILFVSVLISFHNLPTPGQGIFGLWTILPFVFGFWASDLLLPNGAAKHRFFTIIFFISASGVLINTKVAFPWVGGTITVAGTTLNAAESLTTLGITRYGGFALAAFSAATQILTTAIWVIAYSKNRVFSVLVWVVCGVAIVITTSKGLVGSYFILTMFFLTSRYLDTSAALRFAWSRVIWLLLLIDIALPMYAIFFKSSEVNFKSFIAQFLLLSLGDRLSFTWPGSFSLLKSPLDWFIGRGVGGIGASQVIFEPSNEWPADNIFIYMTVSFGLILTLFFLGSFCSRCSSYIMQKRDISPVVIPFALLFLAYGIVAPIMDWPTLSMVFGAIYEAV